MSNPKPTAAHLEWADMELGVIIHYLADIYNPDFKGIKNKGVRTELPVSGFAPDGWDTDQWMRSAAAFGAKYAVLVANHCTGFSLWPTKVNEYSVKNCPYQDGRGDVVRDFIESCKKYGIKPGLYYSTGCNGYYDINDEQVSDETYRTEKYQNYVKAVEAQVTELWSEYGDLFEIWFDGGIVPPEKGGPDLVPILKKYQANAVCFQGPVDHPVNVRWVGNENGLAPWDNPSEWGGKWVPAETDMPNRDHRAFGDGWGWRENEQDHVFSTEHLIECYTRSVGRNSNLLMGMAIGKNGRFEDEQQFIDFGKAIEKTFGEGAKIACAEGTTVLDLEEPADISYIVICEDITEGSHIRGYRVLCDGECVGEGRVIAHKKILTVKRSNVKNVTLEITEAEGEPKIRSIAVY